MNPWERDWGAEAAKALGVPVEAPKEQPKNPWERDWGAMAQEALQKAARASKAVSMDYSTVMGNKSNTEPSRASPEPSIEEVFPKLLHAESKGRHMDASGNLTTSPAGAQGISQLMPSTAAKPGFGIQGVKDQSEGEYLRVGKEYLSALYNKYKDWPKALAAYNAGVGNVEKATGKAERYGGDWRDYLPKKKETIPYIEKILGGRND